MPDTRTHRGPHPADGRLFSAEAVSVIRAAVDDYCLLLSRGYAEAGALKLVGDRFSLARRQRLAVMRASCPDAALAGRRRRCMGVSDLGGGELAIDGYNLLITIEAALGGGCIFRGRDGCLRDLASLHGTYRRVTETVPALEVAGTFLAEHGVFASRWFLDRPVSNSGRLRSLMERIAGENRWGWRVVLAASPDAELKKSPLPVATSDSAVLDACGGWVNLAAEIIAERVPAARVIDLAGEGRDR
jgi:hypothetical protein